MDANKDEALECFAKAKHATRSGNLDKAKRLAEKSIKLFPTKEAEGIVLNNAHPVHFTIPINDTELLASLKNDSRRPNGMGQSSRDRPASNGGRESEQTTTEPEYTAEQKEAVNK